MYSDLEGAAPALNSLGGDRAYMKQGVVQQTSSEDDRHLTSPSSTTATPPPPLTMTLDRLRKEWVVAVPSLPSLQGLPVEVHARRVNTSERRPFS